MESEKTVVEWMKVKKEIDELKKKENHLRIQMCKSILKGMIKGSRSEVIGKYKVTATAKINTSVDEEALLEIWPDLSDEEMACFKFPPKLNMRQYNSLDPEKKRIYSALISKPGLPTISIKEVKEVKE